MSLLDLSHTIVADMPQWASDNQPLKLHRRSLHGPDSHMSSSLEIGCHVGTHIDAPLHFLDGQPGLDRLPVDHFVGPGRVVDCRPQVAAMAEPGPLGAEVLSGLNLDAVDFVLLLTGWDRFWGQDRYYQAWPYLSAELAAAVAAAGLKGIGLDTPSLDSLTGHVAHDLCAAAGLVNIENLTGLDQLVDRNFQFQCLPLKLHDTEASPVRAVAVMEAQ